MNQATVGAEPVERPWYRQFWPWVLVLLPLAAVMGGLATLAIAIVHREPFPVVRDAARPGVVVERPVSGRSGGGGGVPGQTAHTASGQAR